MSPVVAYPIAIAQSEHSTIGEVEQILKMNVLSDSQKALNPELIKTLYMKLFKQVQKSCEIEQVAAQTKKIEDEV
jgi:hypothetical protein